MFLMTAITDIFWIFLFVIYLLFEKSAVATPGAYLAAINSICFKTHLFQGVDIRSKIDMQIQRYIGLKALISLAVGFVVYIILGPILELEMVAMFSFVLHTFLTHISLPFCRQTCFPCSRSC